MMIPHQQNQLTSIRQLREAFPQLQLGISVTSSFAGKMHQLSKQSQSIDFTVLLTGHWTGRKFLLSICRRANIIIHDVEDRQESIHINHTLAPFQWILFDTLTVRSGFLSFRLLLFHTKQLRIMCSLQIGTLQLCIVQVGSFQIGFPEICSAQVDSTKLGVTQVRPYQTGAI